MQNIFGVLDSENCHIDVSNTLIGAKIYATRNGYNRVSVRHNCGYIVAEVAHKNKNGKWVNVLNQAT